MDNHRTCSALSNPGSKISQVCFGVLVPLRGNAHIIRQQYATCPSNSLCARCFIWVIQRVNIKLGLGDPTAIPWGQGVSLTFSRGSHVHGCLVSVVPAGIVWVVLSLTLAQQEESSLDTHHLMPGRPVVSRALQRSDEKLLLEV
ncbi:MAG: hypothetical protein U0Z26_09490 [Anaerolineales bacterium]